MPSRIAGWQSARLLAAAAMFVSAAPAAHGESLQQAMASAYRSNPDLLAQRKSLEATDETVSQAQSGFRPRVVGTADIGRQDVKTRPAVASDGSTTPRGYTIQLSQNVFQGFRTVNALRQAEANVLASRELLRTTEQDVLLSVATAYMDVVRDRAIIRLQQRNVRELTRNLRKTRARLQASDVSRTDVSQSEARRAGAILVLEAAKASLKASSAAFQQVVGRMPQALTEPAAPTRHIPSTIGEATRQAMEEAPGVVRAAFLERAAEHNIDQITGELLPTVDLEASYSNRFEPSNSVRRNESAAIIGRLTFPFYQQGEVSSRVRQARRLREERAQGIESQRRLARSTLITNWSLRQAALLQLRADRLRVRANRAALEGVQAEEAVGQRSVLDVLDAVNELVVAQVSLVSNKRDLVVSSYAILAAIGRLTASDLNLVAEQHNPEVYYGLVRSKAWGTRVLQDEVFDGYVVSGWDTTLHSAPGLVDDVARIAREARDWARTEIYREDVPGTWDGVIVDNTGKGYK